MGVISGFKRGNIRVDKVYRGYTTFYRGYIEIM